MLAFATHICQSSGPIIGKLRVAREGSAYRCRPGLFASVRVVASAWERVDSRIGGASKRRQSSCRYLGVNRAPDRSRADLG